MDLRRKQKNRKIISMFVVLTMVLQCLPLVAIAHSDSMPYPAPIAQWQFNENEGTIAGDATKNEHDGIICGATRVKGKLGNALCFDGKDYVEIAHKADLSLKNTISVEAWINPQRMKVWQRIIAKTPYPDTDYSMFFGDKNNIGFSVKMGKINRTVYSPKNTLRVGTWTHIVGTYDGSRMRIYLNGKQVNSIVVRGKINAHNGALRIGGDPKGDNFKGIIDEVCIYDKALTAQEVLARFRVKEQEPEEPIEPEEPVVGPLIAQLPFNEGNGLTTADQSGNKNNGQISGATWVKGKFGNALSFDGNDYVEIAHSVSLSPRNELAVEAWVNPAEMKVWQRIISKTPHPNTDYSLFFGKEKNIGFSFKSGKIARTVYSGKNSLCIGSWYHVVGTYDGKCLKLYLDGKLVNKVSVQEKINAHDGVLRIGGDPKGDNFKGIIDEVSIYNKALTATEVWEHYQAGATEEEPIKPAEPDIVNAETTTDGKRILLTFDKEMADLPAAPAGFSVKVNGIDNPIENVGLNTNKTIIELTLKNAIYTNDNYVTLFYSATDGKIKATDGGILADLQLAVTNKSQQIRLTAPANITAEATMISITLTWDAVPSAGTYEVECDGEIIDNGTGTSFTHQGLAVASEHSYRIRAKNTAKIGPWSEVIKKSTLPDTEAPTIPQNLVCWEKSTEIIQISWDKASDNVGVAGYLVYEGSTLLGKTERNVFTATGLRAGTKYCFTVKAYDDAQNISDLSAPLCVTTLINGTVSAGENYSILLKDDGTVWTWGTNEYGQLGDGTTTLKTKPEQVIGLESVTAISTEGQHSLALKNDGTVWAWGDNSYGELGIGTRTNAQTEPVQIVGLTDVKAIAAGSNNSFFLKTDGTVWGCGYNGKGQLGNGTTTQSSVPVQVSGLTDVIAIDCGYNHTVALKEDGTVWAWGENSHGQLGDGTTNNIEEPVQVKNLTNIVAITSGNSFCLALKSDGTVWAWGYNQFGGQLGDGTTENKTEPVQVVGLNLVTTIESGRDYSMALKADGTVWAWGAGSYGKLGNGATTHSAVPIQVQGIEWLKAISAGCNHTLALKEDGTLWGWGYNDRQFLTDGTFNNFIKSPVQIKL